MSNRITCSLSFLLLMFSTLAGTGPANAQKTIHGTISDAETGETLPAANILIEGTYRGTISNNDGSYRLSIPDSLLPATVVVRFLGYKTVKRRITAKTDPRLDVSLEPSTFELDEIVVTDEDPGVRIMRLVIERKQQWRKQLETYKAEAYTRQSLANDTSIVMITESVSTAFWDKEKGHREVLKSRRQTANISESENFAGVSYLPNFYDDNIEIAGFDLVGVTHPDALKYYHFKLVDQTTIDDRRVYEISVKPDRKLQPLFEGTVHVLDEEYALLDVSLQPSDVVTFPPPIKGFELDYEQQFNNYGRDFWLPVDMRVNGKIKISMLGLKFPMINFRQLSRITNYEVNVDLPDSLYQDSDLFTVDSTASVTDSLFVRNIETVPLTREEEQAYEELDSTATLEEAFKPTGFLARFVDDDDDDEGSGSGGGFSPFRFLDHLPGQLSPAVRYNRVDELFAGLRYEIRPVKRLELRADGGYSTGYEEFGYGGGATYRLPVISGLSSRIGFNYKAHTVPRYDSRLYSPGFTIPTNLLGEPDYFDYYRSEGYRAFTRWRWVPHNMTLEAGFSSKEQKALSVNTAYDILGQDRLPQVNIPADEGRLHAADIILGYNITEGYNYGVTGLKRVRLSAEFAGGGLGGDFDFTRYQADLDWTFPTFYKRRLLPNTLDIKATAGTFTGDLPVQRFGTIDGVLGYFSPFGSLRTIRNRPYQGEQYAMVVAEHNFRTIPFEILGLRKLVDMNYGMILFAGIGKTWTSAQRLQSLQSRFGSAVRGSDGTHYEAGISLNGVLGLFRVDFARRLDEPAFLVNVSVARIF